jgi:hypothetical protein
MIANNPIKARDRRNTMIANNPIKARDSYN